MENMENMENHQDINRVTSLTPAQRKRKVIAILCCVFMGALFLSVGIYVAKPHILFNENAVQVDAITQTCNLKNTSSNGKTSRSYDATFRYTINNQTYYGDERGLSRCAPNRTMALMVNAAAPQEYMALASLKTAIPMSLIGLFLLVVFIPMIIRHDPNDQTSKFNRMMTALDNWGDRVQKHS